MSLRLRRGEVLGIYGLLGAGRTELLETLLGLHAAASGHISLDGRVLDLTPVEFRLLKTLSSAPGRVFSRRQLQEHLYTDHRVVTERTVDSHVKNLRKKLQKVRPDEDVIHSVYGVGYKLEL